MVTLDDIRAAADRIAPHVHRTPVITSRGLDAATGCRLALKAENLQRGGAFKVRGATNAVLALSEEERAPGVVAYSSGNHAQGVALAALAAGVPATIVMPRDAPRSKRAAVDAYGAEVVEYDRDRESREEIAGRLARELGRPIVPPFDHPDIIAGQGTAALELLEDAGPLDLLLVPVGGGGLLAGACVARGEARTPRILGVEPDGADTGRRALRAGRPVIVEAPRTLCDGLRPPAVGAITLAHFADRVDDIVTVTDDEVAAAVRLLLERTKLLVEPSGAVGVAALLAGRVPAPPGSRAGVILSGGNVDPGVLASILADG